MLPLEGLQRIDHKHNHPLSGFVSLARDTGRGVSRQFRMVRENAPLNNPPVIICSEEQMRGGIVPNKLDINGEQVYAGITYVPAFNTVMISEDDIAKRMLRGPEGTMRLARLMAHQVITAQATVPVGDRLRIGYDMYNLERKKQTLLPGGIYEAKHSESFSSALSPDRLEVIQEDALLTQRVIQLALYSMITHLPKRFFPDTYNYMLLAQEGRAQAILFNGIKEELMKRSMLSLYKSDPSLLIAGNIPPVLLDVINDPNKILLTLGNSAPNTRTQDISAVI